MISLTSAVNISISVSGLAIAVLGLIQAISSRKMEGWNRKFFIILFLMDIETVPQVPTDDSPAEAEIAHHSNVVEVKSAECIDMTINESLLGSST